MKYSLKISGGITGIPRKYEGELDLPAMEQERIKQILNDPPLSKNKNLRDGLQYHVQMHEDDSNYEAYFEDPRIPETIRSFIAKIIKNN